MASVTISERTAKIIEDQLINYNEDNDNYTEFGILVDDLPRLLVRTECPTSSVSNDLTSYEELSYEDIFYDDISLFKDLDGIKQNLMEWYRGKYSYNVALFDELSNGSIYLSKFQIMPRYLKSGDTTKFMIGFKSVPDTCRATVNDIEDLIEYMDQLKTSNRIADNAVIKRVIIGDDDYLESFPKLKQLHTNVDIIRAQNKAMKDCIAKFKSIRNAMDSAMDSVML